jgi:hypothetical protein
MIRAGSLCGINNDTKFALFRDPDNIKSFIGSFGVYHVTSWSSALRTTDATPISLPAYAMQIKVHLACFTENRALKAVKRDIEANKSLLEQYSFVHRGEAPLEIDVEAKWIIFNNVNPQVNSLGFSRMPFRVEMGEYKVVRSVIQAANEFNRLLNLTPAIRKLQRHIKLEFTEVIGDYQLFTSKGDNLCKDGRVQVTAGDNLYGIKVTNNSGLPLYPHLFLFDYSDLSIGKYQVLEIYFQMAHLSLESYYKPPTVKDKDKDAPLQPQNSFAIGYGTGGARPWTLGVRNAKDDIQKGKVGQMAQDLDVGVFKLFLTTMPGDLAPFLEQKSPFLGNSRYGRREDFSHVDEWDTASIEVVVRRE